jgi:hypothetical protein
MLEQNPSRSLRRRVDDASVALDGDRLKRAVAGGSLEGVTADLQRATHEFHSVIKLMRAEGQQDGPWDERRGKRSGHQERQSGQMSKEEAFKILALHPDATADDFNFIRKTYQKAFHSDANKGGTDEKIKKINVAVDVLKKHFAKG